MLSRRSSFPATRRRAPAASMAHSLSLLHAPPYLPGYFVCHLCWEPGSGPLYHCPDCQFDLHTSCAGVGNQQTHFSHYQHPLHLKSVSLGDVCDGCEEKLFSWAYRCTLCNYDLCALCVRAPRFVLHKSHPHVLVLSRVSEFSGACQCDGCGMPASSGMVYRCTSCNFDLHQSCVTLPLKPIHPKHRNHPLTLLFHPENAWSSSSSYTCDDCGREGRGWVYNCSLCRFNLHPACAKIAHEVPRAANMHHAPRHDAMVAPRSNLEDLWPEGDPLSNAHHHHELSIISSPYDRPDSAISPYPYSTLQRSTALDRTPYYSTRRATSIHDPPSYSTLSLHDRPYSSVDDFSNGSDISSDTVVHALRNLTPRLGARDAAAVERVVDLFRKAGSPY